MALRAGIRAFGLDFASYIGGTDNSADTFDIIVGISDMFSISVGDGEFGFFGVTSVMDLTSIVISPPTGHLGIENVTYTTTAVGVPAPAALFLFILGLAGIGAHRARCETVRI